MIEASYPYAVGVIRCRERRLLDKERWNRLREAAPEEALRLLVQDGYGAAAEEKDELEALIAAELAETYALIADIAPEPKLSESFLLSGDAHNLKTLLKCRLLGESAEGLCTQQSLFPVELVRACVQCGDYSALPEKLAASMAALEKALAQDPDPRVLSGLVDNAVYAYLFSLLGKRGSCVKEYFLALVDLRNVLAVLRARSLQWEADKLAPLLVDGGRLPRERLLTALFCPPEHLLSTLCAADVYRRPISQMIEEYTHSGGLEGAELVIDNFLCAELRSGRYDSFGFGPLMGYRLGKELEAKSLRILFAAKRAGLPARLPEQYL